MSGIDHPHTYLLPDLIPTLLFLVLHDLDIVGRYALQQTNAVLDHFENLVTDVSLHNDLVLALRILGDGSACGKLRCKLLGDLLQVDTEGFEAIDGGYVLPFIALDALDDDLVAIEISLL